MTKYEYLKSQSELKKIATWKALGEAKITSETKIYSKDIVYRVMVSTSALNEYLVYCTKDYIGMDINWNAAVYYDSDYGEISFGNDIVSPYFYVVLANAKEDDKYHYDYDSIIEDSDFLRLYATFIPYEDINSTDNVIISEEDYQRCIEVLGAPFITEEELEYTREEITRLAIKPALEEYFHWLPPTKTTTVSVGTSKQTVDMPTDCYTVINVGLQQAGFANTSGYSSPLFFALEQSLYGGYTNGTVISNNAKVSSMGMRNGNAIIGNMQNRALQQALINYTRRVHYEGPYRRANGESYIEVYSNTPGDLDILWARKSLDFNDVAYANRTRVIEYAQACIKELFANLRRQAKSDVPGQIDYGKWLDEARETKKGITEEYKKLVKYGGILRGSL